MAVAKERLAVEQLVSAKNQMASYSTEYESVFSYLIQV